MAAKYRVKATLIVAKVPGAQGNEVYLRSGRVLPASVTATEVKRLLGLGLIEVVPEEVVPEEVGTEEVGTEETAANKTAAK